MRSWLGAGQTIARNGPAYFPWVLYSAGPPRRGSAATGSGAGVRRVLTPELTGYPRCPQNVMGKSYRGR